MTLYSYRQRKTEHTRLVRAGIFPTRYKCIIKTATNFASNVSGAPKTVF